MIKRKRSLLVFIFILITGLFIGCSNKGSDEDVQANANNNEDEEIVYKDFSDEEVTLKIATPWGEEYFMDRIGDYAEENLTHIEIEHIDWDGSVSSLEEHYANDIVPDVFLTFTGQSPLEELDSVFGLDDMLEQYNVDLDHIQPSILDEIRSRDKDNRLVGIPQEVGAIGLYYNKEIFDLFGISHPDPDESMTWEELFELASKMTDERNGTKYCGLEMGGLAITPLHQLSASFTDPETGEVLLTKDPKFTKYMDLISQFYNIHGNQDEDCDFAGKTTAMMVGWHGFLHQMIGGETEEEVIEYKSVFDVVPLPTWYDLPGVAPSPRGVQPWAINNHSENKEAALQFLLMGASEEYQLELARIGTPSVLSTAESIEQYGADNELYADKNTAALFKNTPADPEGKSRWDEYVELDLEEFSESNIDVQEFLRIAQDEAEIKIEDAKAQEGNE